MKRLFAFNAATHVENGEKNRIARTSRINFLLTSNLLLLLSPPQRLPLGTPIKKAIIEKSKARRGRWEEGKGAEASLLSFPFPSCPRAFFFLPSLPTPQGGLCGGESYCFYKRKQWGIKDDAVARKSRSTRMAGPRIPVPSRVCCWFNTLAFSALASNKWH